MLLEDLQKRNQHWVDLSYKFVGLLKTVRSPIADPIVMQVQKLGRLDVSLVRWWDRYQKSNMMEQNPHTSAIINGALDFDSHLYISELWIAGSWNIIYIMHREINKCNRQDKQKRHSFILSHLEELKKKIGKVRTPFAKFQEMGTNIPTVAHPYCNIGYENSNHPGEGTGWNIHGEEITRKSLADAILQLDFVLPHPSEFYQQSTA